MALNADQQETESRQDFYRRIGQHSLRPLWENLHVLVPKTPQPKTLPAIWHYQDVRPYLMESGEIISAEEAIRRVLILENPGLKGQAAITNSMYAGLQLILPGETAPAHRHTQSALRFIVEGDGAFTAVEGEPAVMHQGDLILTPNWNWHDHGHEGSGPMVWLDALDIPLIAFLDAGFAENFPQNKQLISRDEGDAQARYGANMLPVNYSRPQRSSPVFSYPYSIAREALETMRRTEEWDECHGLKMQYINPVTGGPVLPTIGAFLQLLPKGFAGASYRSTDGTIFCVVEGSGHTQVGDTRFDWGPHDVFVVPSWAEHQHYADEEAVLFSYSDRPVQEALDLWREARP